MNVCELRKSLKNGKSSESWVIAISHFFKSYELNYGHGTDNSLDEAYWLLRAQQGWGPESWLQPPNLDLIDSIVELAGRRVIERKPLAYLLGEAWFAGLCFNVDERVLIPRSPLAEVIERGLRPWCWLEATDRVLDIGTGSACLAVAVAHYCPGISVDATEISDVALEVAKANVDQHKFEDKVQLIKSDLFSAVEGRYRVILSNPPYVPRKRLEKLPVEYSHEPMLALDGGISGLDLIDRLLIGAADHLTSNGVLIVEVGEAQEAFMESYPVLPVTWLQFERGGDGVFMLTRDELTGYLEG